MEEMASCRSTIASSCIFASRVVASHGRREVAKRTAFATVFTSQAVPGTSVAIAVEGGLAKAMQGLAPPGREMAESATPKTEAIATITGRPSRSEMARTTPVTAIAVVSTTLARLFRRRPCLAVPVAGRVLAPVVSGPCRPSTEGGIEAPGLGAMASRVFAFASPSGRRAASAAPIACLAYGLGVGLVLRAVPPVETTIVVSRSPAFVCEKTNASRKRRSPAVYAVGGRRDSDGTCNVQVEVVASAARGPIVATTMPLVR